MSEKGLNRYETGATEVDAAPLWLEFLRMSRSDRAASKLIRAVCELTVKHPDRARMGFAKIELFEQIRGRPVAESEFGNAEKTVERYWRELERKPGAEVHGLEDFFEDRGWNRSPKLGKVMGVGDANNTHFLVELSVLPERPCPQEELLVTSPSGEAPPEWRKQSVRYYQTQSSGFGRLKSLASNGWALAGIKGGLGLCFLLFIYCICAYALWLGLDGWMTASSIEGLARAIVFTPLLGALVWYFCRPIFKLGYNRVIRAPWWLQGIRNYDADRLVELRHSEEVDANVLYLTHYFAECSACGGEVRIAEGGREFFGRLVGRCRRAPSEHIYSFDHINRTGSSLR